MKKIQILMLMILLVPLVNAFPTPHGVSGTVYDKTTLAPLKEVSFSVEDLDTGEYIEGKTKNGEYFVTLNGYNGDKILIKSWSEHYSVNRTVILDNVMHNVNLLLNITEEENKEYPPIITSTPLTTIYKNQEYIYEVKAEDPNQDSLEFHLTKWPKGMTFNRETKIISWIPDKIGEFDVMIAVSDGMFVTKQNYSIIVKEAYENSPPIITSTPITTATMHKLYRYYVKVYNPDNDTIIFSLTQKPKNMNINKKTGLLHWVPVESGNFTVEINASDSNLSALQKYTISVPKKEEINISFPLNLTRESEENRLEESVSTGPKEAVRVSGTVYDYPKNKVEEKTAIRITNKRTNETILTETNSGSFYTILEANKNDEINIEILNHKNITKTVKEDINLEITLSNNYLDKITGSFISVPKNAPYLSLLFITISLLLLTVYWRYKSIGKK